MTGKYVCSLFAPQNFDCFAGEKTILCYSTTGGVLHTVVGAFTPDQVRAFHQCNLAASDEPVGPSLEDIKTYA